MLKILQYGSPILEQVSLDVVDIQGDKTIKLINEMLKVLKSEPERSAGLSAPQVGKLLRIAICRRTDLEERNSNKKFDPKKIIWEVMINPVIKKSSTEKSINWEGCLSINNGDLFGQVERPREIEVEYTDLKGEKKNIMARDFFSHVVQHEIDHLNGVLFLRYVDDPSKLYTSDELVD